MNIYSRNIALLAALLAGGTAACSSEEPDPGDDTDMTDDELYNFIDQQVGGIEKLRFPREYAGLPLPQRTDGTLDTSFVISKPLVDLGRFLFGDPALVTHIVTAQENPFCSGEPSTSEQGSCVACHAPASGGGKAGQEIGINVGGEGLFFKGPSGETTFRRRVRPELVDLAPSSCPVTATRSTSLLVTPRRSRPWPTTTASCWAGWRASPGVRLSTPTPMTSRRCSTSHRHCASCTG
jgi:hypothetical protein